MAVFDERNRMYEEDPSDKIIRAIYDDIDARTEKREAMADFNEFDYDVEVMLWQDDVEEWLNDLEIDYNYSLKGVPQERVERIFEHYKDQSMILDDDANYVENDPIPEYCAGNESPKKEIYKLGYALGSAGLIGKYYKLLTDINFCRGFWLGKFEKAVNEDNDEMILDVSRDMKIFDPEIAEAELTDIVNKCFSESPEVDVKNNARKF